MKTHCTVVNQPHYRTTNTIIAAIEFDLCFYCSHFPALASSPLVFGNRKRSTQDFYSVYLFLFKPYTNSWNSSTKNLKFRIQLKDQFNQLQAAHMAHLFRYRKPSNKNSRRNRFNFPIYTAVSTFSGSVVFIKVYIHIVAYRKHVYC